MRKNGMMLMALATALAIAPLAKADTFDITFTGSDYFSNIASLSTTVEATPNGAGYLISGIDSFSYSYSGATYTSAVLVNNYGYEGDSKIYPGDSFNWSANINYVNESGSSDLDWMGLLFLSNGTYIGFRLYVNPSGDVGIDNQYYSYLTAGGSASYIDIAGTMNIVDESTSVIPEPSSYLLLGTGLLGLMLLGGYRKMNSLYL
jgi:hypothetical protein